MLGPALPYTQQQRGQQDAAQIQEQIACILVQARMRVEEHLNNFFGKCPEHEAKEEQEHSRLLARLIEGMGGSLLQHHWSDTCFVFLRRLPGLRMELLVLLVAEVIAQVYYKALHDGTADAVLRSVFAQILHDEHGHVAFHCAYLRQVFGRLSPLARWLISTNWSLLSMFVCLIVIYDHRTVFRAIGVTPRTCWRDCMQAFRATRIFTHE